MNITNKVLHVWSHGLVMTTFLRWLSWLGITIVPYYLFLETADQWSMQINNRPILNKPFEILFLNRSNRRLIKGFDNLSQQVEAEFSDLLDSGSSCVCLTSEGSVFGYGWFDLTMCNYKYLSFELKNNEVYSFNFYTAKHMRGRNIAPFLVRTLYAHFQSLGRDRFYSIAEKFNTPAMKYKNKLKAKRLRYYIYVNLFNRVRKNILIRNLEERLP